MNIAIADRISYKKQRDTYVAIFAAIITFLTYSSVYAFRKPFTAAIYSDVHPIAGLAYKDLLVICQVLGYMLSKFYGIRFIAELKQMGRARLILILVAIAWFSLLFFAIVPTPYNIIFLFINGFPLGIIWGVVFSFVEGRKATDFIGAALSVSFIFSSGFVKSVGKWLMVYAHITEWWMPFLTGLVFVVPLLLFLWLLEKIPPPSPADREVRSVRLPLNKEERKQFFRRFSTGLILLNTIYVLLTVFRDIRDNFAADMWKEMGYGNEPSVFTTTEIPITIIVLILISSMIWIRNNHKAFVIIHLLIMAGFCIAGISSWLFIHQQLGPFAWMTLVGLGLYIGYIPFNCTIFDRMIATFKQAGNVGFLMYMADSFGYLGSVGVILMKTTFSFSLHWTVVYSTGVMYLSVIGIAGTLAALQYFNKKYKTTIHTV